MLIYQEFQRKCIVSYHGSKSAVILEALKLSSECNHVNIMEKENSV